MNRTLLTQLRTIRDDIGANALSRLTDEELEEYLLANLNEVLKDYPCIEALIAEWEASPNPLEKEAAPHLADWLPELRAKAVRRAAMH